MYNNEQVENAIKDIIKEKTCLVEYDDGTYREDIALGWDDELSSISIKKIVQSENPIDEFYNIFYDICISISDSNYDWLLRNIKDNWKIGDYEVYKNTIMDWVNNNVFFNIPKEHYLNQELCVNILVNTGDGDYDFTLNNFVSYNATKNEEIEQESSILWLVKQQGYTEKQLYDIIQQNEDSHGGNFLESVYRECIHVTSHMNALVFFVKMTLRDYLEYQEDPYDIILSENTNCGLCDFWNGAGGLLEIELEKPVKIPKEYVEMHVDGCRGYGVNDIYGMDYGLWG